MENETVAFSGYFFTNFTEKEVETGDPLPTFGPLPVLS